MADAKEDPSLRFIGRFKKAILSDMMAIPDDLFRPGRERELYKRIEEIFDAHLFEDKFPIRYELRFVAIQSFLLDIKDARDGLGSS